MLIQPAVSTLSLRVRAGSEAAPWVVEEIKRQEIFIGQQAERIAELESQVNDLCDLIRDISKAKNDSHP